jgi:tRNA A37 methylthiotransferase MiaB
VRFAELIQRVSEIDPEMRVRFQSPHPKDFPDDVLQLIASTPNICNSLHMPAQHGASSVLERMKRGYSRESYVALVKRARQIIGHGTPEGVGCGISSDFISGFCGETEEEHLVRVALISAGVRNMLSIVP